MRVWGRFEERLSVLFEARPSVLLVEKPSVLSEEKPSDSISEADCISEEPKCHQ